MRPYNPPVPALPLPAVIIGVAAGVVGGLFGVGGGVIVVPGLVLWLKMPQHRAVGTSVAVIVASSATAVILFAGDGEVDWGAALLIFVGAGTGAAIAARYMAKVPAHWLTRTFALIMVLAAIRLILT